MRITRLVAGTVTAGLLGFTPIAVSAPAQAATENLTTTTVAAPDKTKIEFGDEISVSADIDSSDGLTPSGKGTATLLAMEAKTTEWTAVATASPGSSFYGVKPKMNTFYKVAYSGYAATSAYENNYAVSESETFAVGVARQITHPSSGFVLKGKVKPNYAKKKVVIQASKKQKNGYKKVATIKTDKRGKYKFTLPKRRGKWYWVISVKGDSKYLANGFAYETTVS